LIAPAHAFPDKVFLVSGIARKYIVTVRRRHQIA
jgi:hypothetical protein